MGLNLNTASATDSQESKRANLAILSEWEGNMLLPVNYSETSESWAFVAHAWRREEISACVIHQHMNK